ncbi:TPA: AGE family epimerase/isomerase [Vibrio parahaemolyticus]
MRNLDLAASKCQSWLSKVVLPLWAREGQRKNGVFEEGLSSPSEPFSKGVIRFRVQPRQAYVYAHAHQLGWFNSTDIVNNVVENGFNYFQSSTGHYAFSTSDELVINDETQYGYDHAFAILGFGWHYQLTKDEKSLDMAESCYQFFNRFLRDKEYDGFFSSPSEKIVKCQNPHMHLFEALMVLFEVTNNTLWLERADEIYKLFCKRFYNGNNVVEFFDRELLPNHPLSENIDPGHQYEWVWLLSHYAKLRKVDVSDKVMSLMSFAAELGHSATGLVMDEIKQDGSKYRETSRLWCQTEYLKARVAVYESNTTPENEEALVLAVDSIFKFYIEPAQHGLWIDQVDSNGNPISHDAPASTLYHIFLAFSEVCRLRDANH